MARAKSYGSAFLLPEFELEEDVMEWVEENFAWLFEFQLAAWTTDEAAWPTDRSLASFRQWFRVELHSLVVDASDDDLEGDELSRIILAALWAAVLATSALQAQRPGALLSQVTSPKQQFGFDIGDDYRLVNYTQYLEYLRKLDEESDRLSVVDMGPTAEGRRQYLAIITSPENHKRLGEHRDANRRLALAEGLTDEQARQLARQARSVVWIDGGLHATEVLGAQQLIETIYRLSSRTDPETTRILDDDIVLLSIVNPDGMQLVADWYMRERDEKRRSTGGLPRLYQKVHRT